MSTRKKSKSRIPKLETFVNNGIMPMDVGLQQTFLYHSSMRLLFVTYEPTGKVRNAGVLELDTGDVDLFVGKEKARD